VDTAAAAGLDSHHTAPAAVVGTDTDILAVAVAGPVAAVVAGKHRRCTHPEEAGHRTEDTRLVAADRHTTAVSTHQVVEEPGRHMAEGDTPLVVDPRNTADCTAVEHSTQHMQDPGAVQRPQLLLQVDSLHNQQARPKPHPKAQEGRPDLLGKVRTRYRQ
jgi:hypothetical protein